jgi:transposase
MSGMFDLLKGLDLSWQKSRPHHPQADAAAVGAVPKTGYNVVCKVDFSAVVRFA